ncbi:MAG: DNA-directed RNA polymerase subunit alpha C-terminal domain-containing protein [Candidatus Thorarchaeota archaeon]|jgi:DNA-directed RNA polymerase alpha subunit
MNLPEVSKEAWKAISRGIDDEDHIVDLELLGFSQRNINILETQGDIHTIEDVLCTYPKQLLELKNFGKKALTQLFTALGRYHELDELRTIKPIEGSKKKRV